MKGSISIQDLRRLELESLVGYLGVWVEFKALVGLLWGQVGILCFITLQHENVINSNLTVELVNSFISY